MINFKAQMPLTYLTYKSANDLKQPNPITTEQEANEYFLLVDKATASIDPALWDEIYTLDLEQKINLSKIMNLTYKNHGTNKIYPTQVLINPQPNFAKEIDGLFRAGNILNEEEIKMLYEKTEGAFDFKDIEKARKLDHKNSEEIKDNLKFLKKMMKEKNRQYFEEMSPRTAITILNNRIFTYEDLKAGFKTLKEDEACDKAFGYGDNPHFVERNLRVKEAIHECLLGESYYKIEEFDRNDVEHFKNYIKRTYEY